MKGNKNIADISKNSFPPLINVYFYFPESNNEDRSQYVIRLYVHYLMWPQSNYRPGYTVSNSPLQELMRNSFLDSKKTRLQTLFLSGSWPSLLFTPKVSSHTSLRNMEDILRQSPERRLDSRYCLCLGEHREQACILCW